MGAKGDLPYCRDTTHFKQRTSSFALGFVNFLTDLKNMNSSHCRSFDIRAYLHFHVSPIKYEVIWATGLTWKLRCALTSEERKHAQFCHSVSLNCTDLINFGQQSSTEHKT